MVKKFCFLCVVLLALSAQAQNKYKCMVQMTNYSGETAYMVMACRRAYRADSRRP